MSKDILEINGYFPHLTDEFRVSTAKRLWPHLDGVRAKGRHVFSDGPVRYYLCTLPHEAVNSLCRYALRPADRHMKSPVHDVDTICRLYSRDEVLSLAQKGVFRKAAVALVMEDLL